MKIRNAVLTVLSMMLLSKTSTAQNVIDDALKLNATKKIINQKIIVPGSGDNLKVLSSYCKQEKPNCADISTTFSGNPFFDVGGCQMSESESFLNSKGSGLLGSIGGIDVTNIADGLAKFLVERTKQELSIMFFQDFKNTLKDEKYKHLAKLFHNTYSLLLTIDKDIYRFSSYLGSLREAFIKDLNNLFDTAPEVIKDGMFDTIFKNLSPSYLKEIFLYALQITRALKNNHHPGQIIEDFALENGANSDLNNINSVFRLIQLFSSSFKNTLADAKQYWVTADLVKKVLSEPDAFKICLGLIYQKAVNIKIAFTENGKKISVDSLIAANSNNITAYETLVRNAADRFGVVQDALNEIKDKKKSDISYNEYYNFFESVIGVLNMVDDIQNLPGTPVTIPVHFKRFVSLLDNTNELLLDINLKNYSSGIMHLVTIYDTILQPAYASYLDNGGKLIVAYQEFRKKLIKYGGFLASVGEAKNSDEVKQAIEAAALPPGSASVKKHSSFNVSLNAYVGPFYGSQKLASDVKSKNAVGLYTPVGPAFSTGLGNGNNPASFSLFISVIDIGAFTYFRFSDPDNTIANDVKVKLSQVISPGVHAVFGFPRLPLSIGFGHQWMPLLSKVEKDNAILYDSKGKRWEVFLGVDIPLLNFYAKSK